MSRREFSKKVRIAAWERCKGFCEGEGCGAKLFPGKFQFDHIIADSIGGRPELDNCEVLCTACHGEKTAKIDTPRAAKTERMRLKHLGLYPKGQKIPSRPFQRRAG
jgi:5-methylcytosine-specific restriction enzyme A